MKIQKFNLFTENKLNKARKYETSEENEANMMDTKEILIDLEIVDYLYRCNLIDDNFELFQEEGLDWYDLESLETWGLHRPEYGPQMQSPEGFDLPELVKKVKALTITYKNLGNYMKKINN